MPEVGSALNNGVMWFDPRPGQPNSIAPASKPLANICPIVATRNGVPELALGAAGESADRSGRDADPRLCRGSRRRSLEQALLSPRIDAQRHDYPC